MTVPLNPTLAGQLTDARLQAHHAAQLATGAGISYLPPRSDDSHTNLEWISEERALASNVVRAHEPFRIAVALDRLALLLLSGDNQRIDELRLHGTTLEDAASWVRDRVATRGVDPARFTLERHYTIPSHPVFDGAAFDASNGAAFAQLAAWYDTGAAELARVCATNAAASEIRCWPHHFDIATLIPLGPGRSVGVGLEPGDVYYDEPYFYVNVHPAPKREQLTAPLDGSGVWHTHEWIGAVLPGSRVTNGREQITKFLDSATAACKSLASAQ